MPVRLGIELSPVSCRFVELESSPASGQGASHTRVRSFGRLPREGAQTRNALSRFRRHSATAVVWGLQADHRHAVVPHGSFRRMRRDAVTEMQGAGVETRGRVADIFAAHRAKGAPTRSVVVALASTPGLAAATWRLAAEGVRVESIVTPALALMSLARRRREFTAPDRVEAYVALEETTTAVALVRNGLLLAASELSWGFQDDRGVTLGRDEVSSRLADEIERFLAARAARPDVLAQVCICGGLPELRSMAIRLMEQLDVEVETLDSLFGIDSIHPLERASEFREHAADLRLAWAAVADWPAPVNLLRERKRRLAKTMLSRAAVAAGVVTGVGVAWQVQRSEWWRSTSSSQPAPLRTARHAPSESGAPTAPPPVQQPAAPVPVRPVPAPPAVVPSVARAPSQPPARQLPVATPPAESVEARQATVPPPVVVPPPQTPSLVARLPQQPPAVARLSEAPTPAQRSPEAATMTHPAAVPPPVSSQQSAVGSQQSAVGSQQSAVGSQQSAVGSQQSVVGGRQSAVGGRQSAVGSPQSVVVSTQSAVAKADSVASSAASRLGEPAVQPPIAQSPETDSPQVVERRPFPVRRRAAEPEIALPFDAVLGTILFAPERKLAIVDGRIVETGDDVNGARVVEITPTTVLLRDSRGRLRRLGLGGSAR